MPSCAAFHCKNQPKNGIRFFSFPTSNERRALWISNLQRDSWEPSNYSCICEAHFEESQFETNRIDGWRILKPNAVPTIFKRSTESEENHVHQPELLSQNASFSSQSEDHSSLLVPILENAIVDVSEDEKRLLIQEHIVKQSDLQNLCRFCLKSTSELKPISEIIFDKSSLIELMEIFFHIQLNEGMQAPQKICTDCVQILMDFYFFKKKVIFYECSLKEIYERITEETSQETVKDEKIFIDVHEDSSSEPQINKQQETVKDVEKESSLLDHDYCETNEKSIENGMKVNKTKFTCLKCQSNFSAKCELESHCKEMKHRSRTNVLCSICGKVMEKHLMKDHMNSHNNIKSYKCDHCAREFTFRRSLLLHTRIHTGEKPCICKICGKGFRSTSQLHSHKLSHNPKKSDETKPLYKCEICLREFKRENILLAHKTKHAGIFKAVEDRSGSFKCEQCGKTFTTRLRLKQHSLIHGDYNYLCNVCGKCFKTRPAFDQHLTTHSDERPFKCTFCPRSFKSSKVLMRHLRIHTGEKPYQCKVCEKLFRQANTLRTHERIHTGERPFKCTLCDKSFITKQTLEHHRMRVHNTGEAPYMCNLCTKEFLTNALLKKHCKSVHNEEDTENTSIFTT